MSNEETFNHGLLVELTAALNGHDLDRIMAHFADDAEFRGGKVIRKDSYWKIVE